MESDPLPSGPLCLDKDVAPEMKPEPEQDPELNAPADVAMKSQADGVIEVPELPVPPTVAVATGQGEEDEYIMPEASRPHGNRPIISFPERAKL